MDQLVNPSIIQKVFQENPVLSRIRLKADDIQAEYDKAKQDLIYLKNMGMLYVNEGFRATLAKPPLGKARNNQPFTLNDLVCAFYALAETFLLEGVRQGDAWCYSAMGTLTSHRGNTATNADIKCFHFAQAMTWFRWATSLEAPPIASGYPAIAPETLDASAFYRIGHLYYMGLGGTVPPDHRRALEAFESGAKLNVPSCLYEAAVLHMHQGNIAGTTAESTRHFDLAIQRYNALIQLRGEVGLADRVLIGCAYEQLGVAYRKGLGTLPDEDIANHYCQSALDVFKEAAKGGHLLARYKLAFLTAELALHRADPSLYPKTIQLLDQAIAGPNHDYAADAVTAKQAEAHLWAGRLFAKSRNGFKKACDRFYKAIRLGNGQAAIELAAHYFEGDGKKTYSKEARTVLQGHLKNHPDDRLAQWFVEEIQFKEAAEAPQGTPADWFSYADFLHDDLANPDSHLSAIKSRLGDAEHWYRKASDAGHTDAMNGLAVLLYANTDQSDDGATEKAFQLWRTAACQGNLIAVCNLIALFFAQAFEREEFWDILESVRQPLLTEPNATLSAVKLYAVGWLAIPKNAPLLQVDRKLKQPPLLLEAINTLLEAGSEDPWEQAKHNHHRILAYLAKARLLQEGLAPNTSSETTPVVFFRSLLQAAGCHLSLDAQLYLQGFDRGSLLNYAQHCARLVADSMTGQFPTYPNASACLAGIAKRLSQHEIITEQDRLGAEPYLNYLPSSYKLPKLPALTA